MTTPIVIRNYADPLPEDGYAKFEYDELLRNRDLKWIVYKANDLDYVVAQTIYWERVKTEYIVWLGHPFFHSLDAGNHETMYELVESLAAYCYYKMKICSPLYTTAPPNEEQFYQHRENLFKQPMYEMFKKLTKTVNEKEKEIYKALYELGDENNPRIFPVGTERTRALKVFYDALVELQESHKNTDKAIGNYEANVNYRVPWLSEVAEDTLTYFTGGAVVYKGLHIFIL